MIALLALFALSMALPYLADRRTGRRLDRKRADLIAEGEALDVRIAQLEVTVAEMRAVNDANEAMLARNRYLLDLHLAIGRDPFAADVVEERTAAHERARWN